MPRAQGCERAAYMLFLDRVYVERADGSEGSLHFGWMKTPTSAELIRWLRVLARRMSCFLER
jgi:hypothetical protein